MKSQIQFLKENIALKKEMGKDTKFEENLLKTWRGHQQKPLPERTKSKPSVFKGR